MNVQAMRLLIMCVMMAGCTTRQNKLDNETVYNLLSNFSIRLQSEIASVYGEYKYSILNVPERGDWSTYEYQIRDYLMRRSPRSHRYLESWYMLEFSFRDGPLEVRRLDPKAVNNNIMIENKREWNKSLHDLNSFPLNAVFGPIYIIDQWDVIITTMRFIVQNDSVMAYEWIAIHKKDYKGDWFIIEIACVSTGKIHTMYVNEAYID